MKNRLLILLLILLKGITTFSQTTATDFTATDCNGNSHNLFTELNAGKIIVLVWVMPCGACISDAKAGYDAAQTFASTNPGRVIYWLVDDFGNSTCTTISSWANTNGIPSANITVFGNAGNKIDEANFGGSGMPHVVVAGGMNHKIYLNKKSGSNNGTAITQAINQAITTGIIPNEEPIKKFKLSPNPANDKLKLECSANTTEISQIEIYNIIGEKIQTINTEHYFLNSDEIEIDLPNNLPKGNYLLQLRTENDSQSIRFTVIE